MRSGLLCGLRWVFLKSYFVGNYYSECSLHRFNNLMVFMLAELAELKWKSECRSCPYLVDQKNSIFDVVERLSGEKIYLKKLNYKNILILNSGKVRLDYMSQSTSFVMTSHDMTFLTETPDLVLTFIEDSTLLLMRFESYEVVCKRTKLDSYLSGSESVGFIKPTYLPMLTSFRRLSMVAERLFF